MDTPYENHRKMNHKRTFYSPNGFDTIEECQECSARFLHHTSYPEPITMWDGRFEDAPELVRNETPEEIARAEGSE